MFDSVRNNKTLVQVFLALITLPFAFWGVESYVRNAGVGDDVASVGGSKISQQELQTALRDQGERMRASLGRNFNQSMMDRPEVRQAVLDSLVNQRLLNLYAAKSGLAINDAQLGALIQSVPDFQESGKFSRSRYDAYVASQNLSQPEFEARLRQDLNLQQLLGAVREAAVTSHVAGDRWVAALQEEREVSEAQLKPEQFIPQVKLAADAVKNYYESNRKVFETPEQLRAEYLLLSQENLAAQVAVTEEDIKKWYQSHADGYKQNEERRASHILLHAGKDASAAEVKAAQTLADDILAKLKKNPADFAKLAKEYSQDPGSAAKGGDLDWFGRGMMVKPLEEVRAEITEDLKRQAVTKKYAEMAEPFTNTVYEQADSLKPAAEKFKLTIQQSPWLAKGNPVAGPLNNPKLLAALFSDDAVKNKRNTEAVEVAPNTLVSARILEFKPASLLPLETVRSDIEKRLLHDEAAKLARSAGESGLAKLVKGEKADLSWSPVRAISRLGAPGLNPDALRAVFRADVAKLPVYVGVAAADGAYVFYRISQVKPFVSGKATDERSKTLRQQYERVIAEEEFSAWVAALRLRYGVEISKEALENKEQR